MSENFNYRASLGSVGNYQVSGIPFASSSIVAPTGSNTPLEIEFPSVTKFVIVKNHKLKLDIIKYLIYKTNRKKFINGICNR